MGTGETELFENFLSLIENCHYFIAERYQIFQVFHLILFLTELNVQSQLRSLLYYSRYLPSFNFLLHFYTPWRSSDIIVEY